MEQTSVRSRRATSSCAAIAVAVLSMALVSCGSDGPGAAASDASRDGSGTTVRLKLIAFKPSALTVRAGTTVTWQQADPGMHTVTSGTVESGAATVKVHPDGQFASGELATGDDFEFTFTKPGTYPYFCEIHPATMRGEITVR